MKEQKGSRQWSMETGTERDVQMLAYVFDQKAPHNSCVEGCEAK